MSYDNIDQSGNSINILTIGPDNDIYCNICCKGINWPGQYSVPWDTSVIAGEDGDRVFTKCVKIERHTGMDQSKHSIACN